MGQCLGGSMSVHDLKTGKKIKTREIIERYKKKYIKMEISCINGKYRLKHNLSKDIIALEELDKAIDFLIEEFYEQPDC